MCRQGDVLQGGQGQVLPGRGRARQSDASTTMPHLVRALLSALLVVPWCCSTASSCGGKATVCSASLRRYLMAANVLLFASLSSCQGARGFMSGLPRRVLLAETIVRALMCCPDCPCGLGRPRLVHMDQAAGDAEKN